MTDDFALLIAPVIGSIAVYVWMAASLHAVFRKAGEEGWQAWVPVLNLIVLLRLGGFSGWWALVLLVPVVGALALAVLVWISCHRINRAFGVGVGMTVLAVLLLPVWSSILGWGSARWLGREQAVSRPVRGAPTGGLDQRMPPADPAAPYAGGHLRLDSIPPRPATIPPVPPNGWPIAGAPANPAPAAGSPRTAAANSAPALVTSVPSTASRAGDPVEDDLDDAPGVHYAPRRRADLRASAGPPRYADDPSEPDVPVADFPARAAAPHTGTMPALIDHGPHEVPSGPRRAVVPSSGEASAEHLGETRDAPPATLAAAADAGASSPWAPPAQAPPMHTPRLSPAEGEFSDTSAEVSAVAGAPALGVPMAARSSVSARRDEPELPDAEGAFDETIIATRRRTPWMLHPPLGAPIAVTSNVLIVGRRPSSDPRFAHAQLVPVADETRTMSKTHARLELHGDQWSITDLDSTNGVVLVRPDGGEVELVSGAPQAATETFLLGDAELRLSREPGAE